MIHPVVTCRDTNGKRATESLGDRTLKRLEFVKSFTSDSTQRLEQHRSFPLPHSFQQHDEPDEAFSCVGRCSDNHIASVFEKTVLSQSNNLNRSRTRSPKLWGN